MTSQQLEERSQQLEARSQQLEARVETLEKEITELRQLLEMSLKRKEPLEQAGVAFKENPYFDEAVRLGQEWRKSAE